MKKATKAAIFVTAAAALYGAAAAEDDGADGRRDEARSAQGAQK